VTTIHFPSSTTHANVTTGTVLRPTDWRAFAAVSTLAAVKERETRKNAISVPPGPRAAKFLRFRTFWRMSSSHPLADFNPLHLY